jgi:homoserine kinase type II
VAAITPLPADALVELLRRYDLGCLETFWPAGGGVENTNYFVRVGQRTGQRPESREVVLTLLEQPPAAGALLVPLLDACDEAGLPVAPPIRNTNGEPIDRIAGRPALFAPRLLGRHVLNPTLRQCEVVGRFLARFHRTTWRFAPEAPAHPRDRAWLEQRIAHVRSRLSYADAILLDDARIAVSSALRRGDVGRLPAGVVHGDLFRDNVLFTERGLTGVLDFHHASAGYLLYDLAVAANDWCTDSSGQLERDRALALLRAYHRVRPLTHPELWFFSVFALYAALAFWLSRLTAALDPLRPSQRAVKNPDEFRQIVRRHLAHVIDFDPRQLD